MLRLMSGVGIACVLIAFVSYSLPQFGKTLYTSQMAMMVLSLCAWRVGFVRVIETARIHGTVFVVGLETMLTKRVIDLVVSAIGLLVTAPSWAQISCPYGDDCLNAMTVDDEDYFHVQAYTGVVSHADWECYRSRVEPNTHRLVELFASRRV